MGRNSMRPFLGQERAEPFQNADWLDRQLPDSRRLTVFTACRATRPPWDPRPPAASCATPRPPTPPLSPTRRVLLSILRASRVRTPEQQGERFHFARETPPKRERERGEPESEEEDRYGIQEYDHPHMRGSMDSERGEAFLSSPTGSNPDLIGLGTPFPLLAFVVTPYFCGLRSQAPFSFCGHRSKAGFLLLLEMSHWSNASPSPRVHLPLFDALQRRVLSVPVRSLQGQNSRRDCLCGQYSTEYEYVATEFEIWV